jgi:hypothetical protein
LLKKVNPFGKSKTQRRKLVGNVKPLITESILLYPEIQRILYKYAAQPFVTHYANADK